jgi:type III secretion system low calcium response chaperone LcrH/SycD
MLRGDFVTMNSETLLECVKEFFNKGMVLHTIRGIGAEQMESLFGHGAALYKDKQYDEAIRVFQFLCLNDHLQKRYFLFLGASYQKSEQYEAAIRAYSHAAMLDLEDPRIHANVGFCYVALKQQRLAASAFATALRLAEGQSQYIEVQRKSEQALQKLEAGLAAGVAS